MSEVSEGAESSEGSGAAGPRLEDLPGLVSGWLTESGVAHEPPLTLTRVGVGQSNLTYAVTDATDSSDATDHSDSPARPDRRWILRRPPLGHLLASAHDVAREARILTALQDSDVPVPHVFGVWKADGVPMVLMEFVEGLVLDRQKAVESVPEPTRHAIGLSIARALAPVHAVDLDKTGLTDLASHKPYAERQLKRWTTQWQNSKTRESADLDTLTARLAAAIPEQRELTLVHGDFHLRNVIVSPEDGSVASVLDWELCTLGDPLADVGTLMAYWPAAGEAGAGVLSHSSMPGFPNREEMAAAYLEASGRDGSALPFWHALGLWKVAIIAEGVLRRVLDEPRNRAAAYAPTTDQVDSLIATALRTLT